MPVLPWYVTFSTEPEFDPDNEVQPNLLVPGIIELVYPFSQGKLVYVIDRVRDQDVQLPGRLTIENGIFYLWPDDRGRIPGRAPMIAFTFDDIETVQVQGGRGVMPGMPGGAFVSFWLKPIDK
jgi:hypothetical protein